MKNIQCIELNKTQMPVWCLKPHFLDSAEHSLWARFYVGCFIVCPLPTLRSSQILVPNPHVCILITLLPSYRDSRVSSFTFASLTAAGSLDSVSQLARRLNLDPVEAAVMAGVFAS